MNDRTCHSINRFEGTLKSWNDERGFGFIEPTLGDQEIFVHIKAFAARSERPQVGQRVSFEVEVNSEGKKRAKRVQTARSQRTLRRQLNDSPARWGTASYFAIPAFLLVYLLVALIWHVPEWVAGLYLAASVACFVVYAIDKSAAVAGRRRVAEATLLLLGLAGGWPGAIVAHPTSQVQQGGVSICVLGQRNAERFRLRFAQFAAPVGAPELILSLRQGQFGICY